MTSYQKLKAENKRLRQDIYNLVRKKNEIEGIATFMKYDIQYSCEDMVWGGSLPEGNNTYTGLLAMLK